MSLFTAAILRLNKLIYNNDAADHIGDAAGLLPSAADGTWRVVAHTASPGVGGTQETNRCTYTGYADLSVPRDGTVFDGTVNPVDLLSDLVFGLCTAGTEDITHISIGFDISATNYPFQIFTVTPTIHVAPGVTPRITAGDLNTTS